MKTIRYESPIECEGPTVFLAGPTVRGNQQHLTSWRFEAITIFEKLGFSGTIIIPEFLDKTRSDKGRTDLPIWEFKGLRESDCIMFWIPRTRELIGLTTNCEFGYWMGKFRRKMVYGRPDDAYRIDYLDIMWKEDYEVNWKHNNSYIDILNTLDSTVKASINMAHTMYSVKLICKQLESIPNVP